MPPKNGYIAAGAVTAGLIMAGGLSAASAATGSSTTAPTYGYSAQTEGSSGDHGPRGPKHQHTAVTGTEAESVKDAVKAKDSAITVNSVEKDPDGSYDVHGTKSGKDIHVDVSKDLKTVEVKQGHGGKGPGGRDGRHRPTPATADETTKVKDAVKAKDSAITVNSVDKDHKGNFHVRGTKAGKEIHLHVSKDLKTIEEHTGGPRVDGGPQGQRPAPGGQSGQNQPAPSDSATHGG